MAKKPKNKAPEDNQEVLENDLLRDTREEIARERLIKFMRRFGLIFGSIAFVAVAIGFAYISWQKLQKSDSDEKSNAYYSAVDKIIKQDKDSFPVAHQELETLKGNKGYEVLGDLAKAKMLLIEGEEDKAKQVYSNLASSQQELDIYQDYGQIMVAFRELESDAGLTDQTIANLENITQKPVGFGNIAAEVKALDKIKKGKPTEAAEDLKYFLDTVSNMSVTQRNRIEKIIAHLEAE